MDTNVMLSASTFRSANAVRTIELASGRDHGLGRREDRQPFHHHADRVRERVLMTFPRRLEAEWRSQPRVRPARNMRASSVSRMRRSVTVNARMGPPFSGR